MSLASPSDARRAIFPVSADVRWASGLLLFGSLVGLFMPAALEGGLEIYFLVLGLIIVVGIFSMPRKKAFSDQACWVIFIVFLSLYSIYPHYISLRISGLPWVSPVRITLALLLFVWLYACRHSPDMGDILRRHVRENRTFFIFFGIFVASQLLSLATSHLPSQALTKFLLFQFTWTFPFLATITLIRTGQRLRLLAALFVVFAAVQCAIGFMEAKLERLLWLDFLPPGFGADSEILGRIIEGRFRADDYRVQGSFSVSLVYAEYLVMMLPFAIFAFIGGRSRSLRLAGLVTAIAILPAQFLSGARLGTVGAIVVCILFLIVHVLRIKKADKRSILGPFLVLMLPFAVAGFAAAYVVSPRLQSMTIGGGQHQASTDGRIEQIMMGIPRIAERPLFGHGIGIGAETLGFRSPVGILTIDSYVLSLLLEVGLVGTAGFVGMITWMIIAGIRTSFRTGHQPNYLGGAIALSVAAFATTKLVLSQVDTQPLIFIVMGLGLVVRTGLHPLPATEASNAAKGAQGIGRRQARMRVRRVGAVTPQAHLERTRT